MTKSPAKTPAKTPAQRAAASRAKRLATTGGKRLSVIITDKQVLKALERLTKKHGTQGKAIACALVHLDSSNRRAREVIACTGDAELRIERIPPR